MTGTVELDHGDDPTPADLIEVHCPQCGKYLGAIPRTADDDGYRWELCSDRCVEADAL